MNKYFLTNKNNLLEKLMDPFEMFYINEKFKYHKGSYKKFKEFGFITGNPYSSFFNKKVKSKLLLDIDPYQKMFIKK